MIELVVLQGDIPGRKVSLATAELTIGRDASADLVLPYPAISRRHAKLFHRDGIWYVADLDSGNGTIVNGTRISSAPIQLRPGDVIHIGPIVLGVQDSDAPPQAIHAGSAETQPPFTQGMPIVSQATQQIVPPPQITGAALASGGHPQMPAQHGMQQQALIVQGKQNLTWLWIFLCLVALGPCGLLLVAILAMAVLPFVLVIGGLIAGCVGMMMYRQFQGYPGWERHATKGMILMTGGFASAVLGAIWIFVAWLSPGSGTWNSPQARPSYEDPSPSRPPADF